VAVKATVSPEMTGMVYVSRLTTNDHGGEESVTLRTAWHHEDIPPRGNARSNIMPVPPPQ